MRAWEKGVGSTLRVGFQGLGMWRRPVKSCVGRLHLRIECAGTYVDFKSCGGYLYLDSLGYYIRARVGYVGRSSALRLAVFLRVF